jgi:peptidyl-prolyl cis-trans isomerase C
MKRAIFLIFMAATFLITGCSKTTPTTLPTQIIQTPLPPTPTSAPLALRVNGEGILLSEYNADLVRLQQAQTTIGQVTTPEDQKSKLVTNYVDQLLLSQAAVQAGFAVDDAALQARIDKLISDVGGIEKLTAWQTTNGYTDESFRTALRREILAGWQRDKIIESVPTTADQVHARQILVQDEANADAYYSQLNSGADFATLAYMQDPTLGGDLGWFPMGTLTQPEVEKAAFSLQVDEYSEIIKSKIGYHILYIIERDPAHLLSIDARRILQEIELNKWLDASRAVSSIEILVP